MRSRSASSVGFVANAATGDDQSADGGQGVISPTSLALEKGLHAQQVGDR